MRIDMNQACDEAVVQAAKQICAAALTAPKTCGKDTITCAILTGGDVEPLLSEMVRIEQETPGCRPFFIRDAKLVAQCPAVVLIGVKNLARGLNPCGLCGHADCGDCHASGGHCCFDDVDLGIAIGSAASMAADLRMDNRVLYTAGMAAKNLKLLGDGVSTIVALPLSATHQNIFFVRSNPTCEPAK